LLLKKSPLFGYFFRRSGKSNRPPRRRFAARSCQASPQLQTPHPAPQVNACTRVKAEPKRRIPATAGGRLPPLHPPKISAAIATGDATDSVPYKRKA
ncbi:MAG: hypothetical protein LBO63_03645, partial [Oscillospiraceae bacterium]|nr:hypothetical protein [Oscillospiraceae bacterium]